MESKIYVLWTESIRLEDISHSNFRDECGLYLISTYNGGEEQILYVGKTLATFSKRLAQHIRRNYGSGAFLSAKGEKFIRFGIVPRTGRMSDKLYSGLVSRAEVFCIESYKPMYNISPGGTPVKYRGINVCTVRIRDLVLNQLTIP